MESLGVSKGDKGVGVGIVVFRFSIAVFGLNVLVLFFILYSMLYFILVYSE